MHRNIYTWYIAYSRQAVTQQTDHLRTFLPQAKPKPSQGAAICCENAHARGLQSVRACLVAVLLSKKQWSLKMKIENRRLVFPSFLWHTLSFTQSCSLLLFCFLDCAAQNCCCRWWFVANFVFRSFSFAHGCFAMMLLKCRRCCCWLYVNFFHHWRAFTRANFTMATLIGCVCVFECTEHYNISIRRKPRKRMQFILADRSFRWPTIA